MKKIQFTETINASAEKVYKVTLGIDSIENYKKWTAEFNPTSSYIGTWAKNSKMLFIGTGENGEKGGMVSMIAENIPNKFVSIKHIGMVQGDIEITEGPEVEKWTGSLENYTFIENDGITTLTIDIDVAEEYEEYFNDTWPRALRALKQICES